mgnify:CR=1 FL=1
MPMDYEHAKGALETFIKESGGNAETMDKFTFKKKDLEGKEGSVMVLNSWKNSFLKKLSPPSH